MRITQHVLKDYGFSAKDAQELMDKISSLGIYAKTIKETTQKGTKFGSTAQTIMFVRSFDLQESIAALNKYILRPHNKRVNVAKWKKSIDLLEKIRLAELKRLQEEQKEAASA